MYTVSAIGGNFSTNSCSDSRSRHFSFEVYSQEGIIMETKPQKFNWHETPDGKFYRQIAAGLAIATAIVLLV